MPIELIVLLLLVGGCTGVIQSRTNFEPSLLAIPAIWLFLPVFQMSFDMAFLIIVASVISAFIPINIYLWTKSIKQSGSEIQGLSRYATGIAMGAIIGAQLLSLSNVLAFKLCFTLIACIAIYNLSAKQFVLSQPVTRQRTKEKYTFLQLPIGLVIGLFSVFSGSNGQVIGSTLTQSRMQQYGFTIFASIAAMVGFIFPAQSATNIVHLNFLAGAIHIPSAIVIAISHGVSFWLSQGRGNSLDRNVLSISVIVFLGCFLGRLWIQ